MIELIFIILFLDYLGAISIVSIMKLFLRKIFNLLVALGAILYKKYIMNNNNKDNNKERRRISKKLRIKKGQTF